jgi:hypothetical protein
MAYYTYCIDGRDFESLQECFLPEAIATYGPRSVGSRAEIMALMKFMLVPLDVTQHNFMNWTIDVDGDNAKFRSNIIAQHVRYGTAGGETLMSGGEYRVELKRVGGKWKIAAVKAGPKWKVGNEDVMPKPPARLP